MPNCPACGSEVFSQFKSSPRLSVIRCSLCGLLIANFSNSKDQKEEFGHLDIDKYIESVGTVRTTQARSMLRSLNSVALQGSRILDIGCSFGWFLKEAQEAGYTVRGLEPETDALRYARDLVGSDLVTADMLDETFPPASVDIVATLDVLEHIEPSEHQSFAKNVRGALTPAGLWLIKVPSTEGLYFRLTHLVDRFAPTIAAPLVDRLWQTHYRYPHVVYFSKRSLACWLNRHGFDVVNTGYVLELPLRTMLSRLRTDGRIPPWLSWILLPAILVVNALEKGRGKTDSLVIIARARTDGAV